MVKNVIGCIGAAAHRLLGNWRASLVMLLLYLAMLAAIYFFLTTRESTVGELAVMAITVLIAPVLFFLIQFMGVSYMAGESGLGRLLMRSLKGFWKLVIAAIPFVLLAWLVVYLIGKIPSGTTAAHEAVRATGSAAHAVAHRAPESTDWRGVAVAALEFLLLGVAVPLVTINSWIAAASDGLGRAARRAHRILYRSFAPGSMLIYLAGFLIFGVVPYLLIELRPLIKGEWIEVGQVGVKLALAVVFSLFGWILTLGALTERQKSEALAGQGKG